MSLESVKEAHEVLTGKLGDVNRQLVFAGIAVLWIFKYAGPGGTIALPQALILPAFLFAASLAAELLQYLYSSLLYSVMYHYFDHKYRKESSSDEEYQEKSEACDHHRALDYPSYALLSLKVLLNVVAYCLLLRYLIDMLT